MMPLKCSSLLTILNFRSPFISMACSVLSLWGTYLHIICICVWIIMSRKVGYIYFSMQSGCRIILLSSRVPLTSAHACHPIHSEIGKRLTDKFSLTYATHWPNPMHLQCKEVACVRCRHPLNIQLGHHNCNRTQILTSFSMNGSSREATKWIILSRITSSHITYGVRIGTVVKLP